MFLDTTLLLSNAQAITVTAPSTVIYDITGAGSGNAPNLSWGTSTVFGADIGAGDGAARPTLYVSVPTQFVSGGGATLQIQLQAAIDNGSNAPSSYTTIVETGTFTAAQLVAGANLTIPIPPVTIGEAYPRFYRVNYVVAVSTFSAGAITTGILLTAPAGVGGTLYPNNFSVV